MSQQQTNRESWLQLAADKLRPLFTKHGHTLPEKIHVSCGFPSVGALASPGSLGECWDNECSVDGTNQLFVSPLISDPVRVLDVLVHELGHTLFGPEVGHKLPFKKFCRTIGLEGKVTATQAGPELLKALTEIAEELGPYPHSKLVPKERKKRKGAMQKLVCKANPTHEETDIVVRASKKVTDLGVPSCFCGALFEIVKGENDE